MSKYNQTQPRSDQTWTLSEQSHPPAALRAAWGVALVRKGLYLITPGSYLIAFGHFLLFPALARIDSVGKIPFNFGLYFDKEAPTNKETNSNSLSRLRAEESRALEEMARQTETEVFGPRSTADYWTEALLRS